MSALANGTLLEGRYELEGPIGRGGMAAVYRARDRRLGRPVAVKVLDEHDRDTAGVAFREDRITAKLAHPHIATIYDSGATPDGRPFLVMELIDGAPVSRLAPLPVARVLAVAGDVAAAVAHAHAQGVVHCDLKPQNVLLDAFGRARLTDFGVASADQAPVGEVVYGSAAYIAPERLRGAPTSPAVDIYALGATLYFLIAGRPPYSGTSGDEIIAQLKAGPPPPLTSLVPTVAPAVDAIVRRAMAPDPADRYPSAAALRDAIEEVRRVSSEHTRALPIVPAPAPAADTAVITRALPEAPAASPPHAPAAPAAPSPAGARAPARWLLLLLAVLLLAALAFGLVRAVAGVAGGGDVGGATVEVPAIEGLSLDQAFRALSESGLRPGNVSIAPIPGQPARTVIRQSVPAGTSVRRGTPVNFVIAP